MSQDAEMQLHYDSRVMCAPGWRRPGDSEIAGAKAIQFKRKIKAKDIVDDIRQGVTDSQLMRRYGLSVKGLQSVFTKLVQAKAILPGELFDRAPVLAEDSVTVESIRRDPREKLEISIHVSDAADSKQEGILRDLSLAGIGVRGIETRKGEVRTLAVTASQMFPVDIFSFDTICRWVKRKRSEGIVDAGFEITNISDEATKQLKTIIRLLNLRE